MSADYQLGLRMLRRMFDATSASDETANDAARATDRLTEYGDQPEAIDRHQVEALGRLTREEVGRDPA